MGIHGLFAGLALGVQSHYQKMIDMFIAMFIHKWSEALTVGIIFVKSGLSDKRCILMIFFLSLFTPLGIFIGHMMSVNIMMSGICKALSSGTFIYISCAEIIIEEFQISKHKFLKFFMYCLGIGFVVLITLLE